MSAWHGKYVIGLTGNIATGKSVVRKMLAGIDCLERHLDEPDSGLYDPAHTHATYVEMMRQAEEVLSSGRCVVLDATFLKEKHRRLVYELGKRLQVSVVPVHCVAPDEVVKSWLEKRLKSRCESDGRWEIVVHQKKVFSGFDESEEVVSINMAKMMGEQWLKTYCGCIDELGRRL